VNYPQLVSTMTDADSDTSATSQTISLPPTYSAGDLLVLFLSTQTNATGTINTPSGWTATFQTAGGAGTQMLAMFYKVATGSEGSTVTVTITASTRLIGNAYAIQAGTYTGTPTYASVGDSGASTSADPPSLTPGAGSTKYLWIAAVACGPGSAPTGLPTGFGNQIDAVLTGTSRPTLSSAREELTASSLDPTAFTILSARWITATVAIQGI
jgi:hypothetical protein